MKKIVLEQIVGKIVENKLKSLNEGFVPTIEIIKPGQSYDAVGNAYTSNDKTLKTLTFDTIEDAKIEYKKLMKKYKTDKQGRSWKLRIELHRNF